MQLTTNDYGLIARIADHRHLNSEKLKVKNEWLSNSIHYSLFTLHLTGAKLRYHKGQSQGKGLLEVRIYTIKKYVKYLTEVSGQKSEDMTQWSAY